MQISGAPAVFKVWYYLQKFRMIFISKVAEIELSEEVSEIFYVYLTYSMKVGRSSKTLSLPYAWRPTQTLVGLSRGRERVKSGALWSEPSRDTTWHA